MACVAWVERRIQLVGPRVVLVMGAGAARALGLPVERRGWSTLGGVATCYTWHPDELAADANLKRAAFDHLKEVRTRIG
jgi:uracil-DNA glycosylase